jgi:quercetin dioxygenase-like cupin family protein
MEKISLTTSARQLVERATQVGAGHAAETVLGGRDRVLRQTVVGMRQGSRLAEHENPGEATIHVLDGRVRLVSGAQSWEASAGELIIVPDARHSLEALEDSAILLTVAKLP